MLCNGLTYPSIPYRRGLERIARYLTCPPFWYPVLGGPVLLGDRSDVEATSAQRIENEHADEVERLEINLGPGRRGKMDGES